LYHRATIWFSCNGPEWHLHKSPEEHYLVSEAVGSEGAYFGNDELIPSLTVLKFHSNPRAHYRLGPAGIAIQPMHTISTWYRSGSGAVLEGGMTLWGNDVPFLPLTQGLFLADPGGPADMLCYHYQDDENVITESHNLSNSAEWKLFTMTFDGREALLYVNGEYVGTAPEYLSYSNPNADQFVLSNSRDDADGNYKCGGASGRFANFAFWNDRVLSEGEIKLLYNSGNPINKF
jgi:hypothetical protein